MDFLTDLGIISTGLAVGGAFLAMGWKADGLISQKASDDLSNYLLNPKRAQSVKTASLWPQVFIEFFDRVFGQKHLSFNCFIRSSTASIVAVIICTAIVTIVAENGLAEGQENRYLDLLRNNPSALLLALILFNVFPDYISLLETRFVIEKIRKTQSFIVRCIWIIFDLVATFIVFYIGMIIAWGVVALLDFALGFERVNDYSLPKYHPESLTNLLGDAFTYLPVFFLTTFFTSIWVWLYVAAQIVTRLIGPLRKSIRFLQYLLPVDTKPLQSVCTVMAVISCLITWVILAPFELASLF